MLYDATGKFGVGIAMPCDPPVMDRRLNASCWPEEEQRDRDDRERRGSRPVGDPAHRHGNDRDAEPDQGQDVERPVAVADRDVREEKIPIAYAPMPKNAA